MSIALSESVVDGLAVAGTAAGATVSTVVGLVVDQASLHNLLAGNLALGAWEGWMGTLAIVVGVYLLGYRHVWQRLAERRRVTRPLRG